MARKQEAANGSNPEAEEQEPNSMGQDLKAEQEDVSETADARAEVDLSETLQISADELENASKEDLLAHLEELQTQAEEYLDGWQRARAEFINYKNRVNREREEARARIAGEVILQYLDVMDDLERALQDQPSNEDSRAWAEGIEMIHLKLKAILESEGVEPIEGQGQPFDPLYHEAISYEESDEYNNSQVIDVVQKGYKLGDRVLRPAMVRVAK